MINTKDLALVILFAVVHLVYALLVLQIGFLVTGIPGSNYLFIIGPAIFTTVAFLLFEGRRWRLVLLMSLFGLLSLPTYTMGTPYNILPRIPLVLCAFQADILFNTFYPAFRHDLLMAKESIVIFSPFVTTNGTSRWMDILGPKISEMVNVRLVARPCGDQGGVS